MQEEALHEARKEESKKRRNCCYKEELKLEEEISQSPNFKEPIWTGRDF